MHLPVQHLDCPLPSNKNLITTTYTAIFDAQLHGHYWPIKTNMYIYIYIHIDTYQCVSKALASVNHVLGVGFQPQPVAEAIQISTHIDLCRKAKEGMDILLGFMRV